MLKRILIWVLVIALAYFLFSTVAKSCNNKAGDAAGAAANTIGNATKKTVDKVKEIASFEDDDVAPSSSQAERQTSNQKTELDDEDRAYDDDTAESTTTSTGEGSADTETNDTEERLASEAAARAKAAAAREATNGVSDTGRTSTESASSSIGNRKYLVVAGSYKERVNAEIMVKKLKKMGYSDAEVFTFDFAEYYSVTAGRYASEKEARSTATTLKSKGVDAYPHKMRSKYFD